LISQVLRCWEIEDELTGQNAQTWRRSHLSNLERTGRSPRSKGPDSLQKTRGLNKRAKVEGREEGREGTKKKEGRRVVIRRMKFKWKFRPGVGGKEKTGLSTFKILFFPRLFTLHFGLHALG
jgi:hypothetical protein